MILLFCPYFVLHQILNVPVCERSNNVIVLYQTQPVAYKLRNSNYELAIGKLERNETGHLANLKYTMLYIYGQACKANFQYVVPR